MKRAFVCALAAVSAAALTACFEDDRTAGPPTYWDDMAPIFNAKCVKCHQAGGIAPFVLDVFQPARANAARIAAATQAGTMPPYLVTHDGSCGDFEHAETLTAAERTRIWEWATGERREGVPRPIAAPPVDGLGSAGVTEWTTPTIEPVAQGGDYARHDEYRCFVVEPGLDSDRFITAYEVVPGTPALVHHVIAFLIDPEAPARDGRRNGEVMAALDAEDPDRPGWPCFGMAGKGLDVEAVPAIWAPGQGPVSYPAGVGVAHRRQHKLVVQLHYNLADARTRGLSDSTRLRLRHAASVERRAVFIAEDGFLDSALDGMPMSLPPGQRSVTRSWRRTLGDMGFEGVPRIDLLAVMPHMHERGVRKHVRIASPGAAPTCAAEVQRWDFHWQKMYFYRTPPQLLPTSELELTCEYDTSADREPVTPGWGTRNEMCTAIMMMALPPGM